MVSPLKTQLAAAEKLAADTGKKLQAMTSEKAQLERRIHQLSQENTQLKASSVQQAELRAAQQTAERFMREVENKTRENNDLQAQLQALKEKDTRQTKETGNLSRLFDNATSQNKALQQKLAELQKQLKIDPREVNRQMSELLDTQGKLEEQLRQSTIEVNRLKAANTLSNSFITGLQQELATLKTQASVSQKRISELEGINAQQATQITTLQQQLKVKDPVLSQLQKENATTTAENRRIQQQLQETQNRLSNAEVSLNQADTERTIDKRRIGTLEKEKQAAEALQNQLRTRITTLEQQISSLISQTQMDKTTLQRQVSEKEEQLTRANTLLQQASSGNDVSAQTINTLKTEKEGLSKVGDELRSQITALEQRLRSATEQAQTEKASLQEALRELETRASSGQAEQNTALNRLRTENETLLRERVQNQATVTKLEQQIAQYKKTTQELEEQITSNKQTIASLQPLEAIVKSSAATIKELEALNETYKTKLAAEQLQLSQALREIATLKSQPSAIPAEQQRAPTISPSIRPITPPTVVQTPTPSGTTSPEALVEPYEITPQFSQEVVSREPLSSEYSQRLVQKLETIATKKGMEGSLRALDNSRLIRDLALQAQKQPLRQDQIYSSQQANDYANEQNLIFNRFDFENLPPKVITLLMEAYESFPKQSIDQFSPLFHFARDQIVDLEYIIRTQTRDLSAQIQNQLHIPREGHASLSELNAFVNNLEERIENAVMTASALEVQPSVTPASTPTPASTTSKPAALSQEEQPAQPNPLLAALRQGQAVLHPPKPQNNTPVKGRPANDLFSVLKEGLKGRATATNNSIHEEEEENDIEIDQASQSYHEKTPSMTALNKTLRDLKDNSNRKYLPSVLPEDDFYTGTDLQKVPELRSAMANKDGRLAQISPASQKKRLLFLEKVQQHITEAKALEQDLKSYNQKLEAATRDLRYLSPDNQRALQAHHAFDLALCSQLKTKETLAQKQRELDGLSQTIQTTKALRKKITELNATLEKLKKQFPTNNELKKLNNLPETATEENWRALNKQIIDAQKTERPQGDHLAGIRAGKQKKKAEEKKQENVQRPNTPPTDSSEINIDWDTE